MSAWAALPPFIGKYNLGQSLGKGSFSIVKEGVDTETHSKFAIKIIPKSNLSTPADIERFEREVSVILKMNHPGIIKIHDFLVDPSFFYLVMEHCAGDTLMNLTAVPGEIHETSSKPLFKQILETVNYIHQQGIAHRDLKLENIMMDAHGCIKIIDFGFSRFANQLCSTPCGSPAYASPEVIGGQNYDGKAADMWSCGVILFALVTGELPWRGSNQVQIYKQISTGSFEMPEGVSTLCSDLIKKLLVPEAQMRLTASEALKHPWLDGIEVSWTEQNNKIKPTISERTFVKILSDSGSAADKTQMTSPRTILRQMGTRQNVKAAVAQSKGSLSFGPKTPSPVAHNVLKISGGIISMNENSGLRSPSGRNLTLNPTNS